MSQQTSSRLRPQRAQAAMRFLSNRLFLSGLCLALLLAVSPTLWPGVAQAQGRTVLYVDRDALGPPHNGQSWATAYLTVQDGLDAANANSATDYEIWVAEGTYYPDEGGSHVDNSRSESFRIAYDNVQLYGGFAATETMRAERDRIAHPVILSGDIDGDGMPANNAYHVVYLDGVTNEDITTATMLDGFTMSGGNASGSNSLNYTGGGGTVNYSDTVTLTATGQQRLAFVNWTEGETEVSTSPSFHFTALRNHALVAHFAPLPLAFNDAAGVLEGGAVAVPVLANDFDAAGSGLAVIAVTQPAHGAATINAGRASVYYTSTAGFSDEDSFTYTLEDANGLTSTALVAVVIAPPAQTDEQPQLAILNHAAQQTAHFTSSQASVQVGVPAGFYTGTLAPTDVFFLAHTPLVTPTEDTLTPPANLRFGNFEFHLTAHLNDTALHGFHFAQPLQLTIRYDPALLEELDPATLQLQFRQEGGWSTEGVTVMSHEVANATLVIALDHLSEFAFFAAPAPLDINRLYLPMIK